jgi:hypothetical protein
MIIVCSKFSIYDNFVHNSINEYLTWLDATYDKDFLTNINESYCISKYGKLPNVILILEVCKEIEQLRRVYPDAKIVTYTNDVHYFSKEQRSLKYNTYLNSDYIIAYYNKFKRFYDLEKKIYPVTHNCCSIFKRDSINERSVKKIFFYGCTGKHYPLREQFLSNMKRYKNYLVVKNHPGYMYNTAEEAMNTTKDTANELNQYFCAFTCGAFPDFEIKEIPDDSYYLLGKFFEIMGNGPLLLCNDYKVREQLETLGFYRDKHYIHIDNSNFDEIIRYIFNDSNRDKILEIRRAGHRKTLEEFYSAHLNRKLNNFLLKLDNFEDVSQMIVDSM